MADTNGDGGPDFAAQNQNQQPGIHIIAQYLKDISFENPAAPQSLRPAQTAPSLEINVNVNARPQSQSEFEVELHFEGRAKRGEDTLFIVDVTYAGLFHIRNVPPEHMHPLLLIECPRLLFPFARQIIAEATQQGGFSPLYLDPVDFALLYRQRIADAVATQGAA
jgi:preprotein translocase subunit SecB